MNAFFAGWLANFKKEFRNGSPVLALFVIIGFLPVSAGWKVLIEVIVTVILVALVAWAVRSTSRNQAASSDQSGAAS